MFYSSTDNKWLTCTEHASFLPLKGNQQHTSEGHQNETSFKGGSHAGLISCMSRRTFSQQLRNKIIVQLLSLLHSFLFLLPNVQVLMILDPFGISMFLRLIQLMNHSLQFGPPLFLSIKDSASAST